MNILFSAHSNIHSAITEQYTEKANTKQTAYPQNSAQQASKWTICYRVQVTPEFSIFHLIYKNWSYSAFNQQPTDKTTIDNFPSTAGSQAGPHSANGSQMCVLIVRHISSAIVIGIRLLPSTTDQVPTKAIWNSCITLEILKIPLICFQQPVL